MLIVGIYLMIETNASCIKTKCNDERNCCFGKKKEKFTLRERNLENELNKIEDESMIKGHKSESNQPIDKIYYDAEEPEEVYYDAEEPKEN